MLITLGIIGVVAALTIPTLISNYNRKIIETRLVNFYAVMNNAVKLSEIENGDKESWISYPYSVKDFYNEYFSKYIKVARAEFDGEHSMYVYFLNGSAMFMSDINNTSKPHILFYPLGKIDENGKRGKDSFMFLFNAISPSEGSYNAYCSTPYFNFATSGIDVYSFVVNGDWDNERNCRDVNVPNNKEDLQDYLMNATNYGCKYDGAYCAALIKLNNWKIPKDYPFNF